uniref:WEB family protein At5g55860 n=1 Tax=Tanacetum cinerariifolium TaxID=118510 RepID=A0A6L2JBD4_TANCI|nr:WEB family protein At5g55860 [Tanacetum cinerariifolium]
MFNMNERVYNLQSQSTSVTYHVLMFHPQSYLSSIISNDSSSISSSDSSLIISNTRERVNSGLGAFTMTTNALFQSDKIDLCDSDCDEVPTAEANFMENLSSSDSEVLSKRIKPTLYDGSVIAKEHAVISVIDGEETLILKEESRSKMLDKQNDLISIEKEIKISPIDFSKLNKIKEDFGKRFVTQKELSAEQAFWLKHSSFSETPVMSHTPIRIEAPSELPKNSLYLLIKGFRVRGKTKKASKRRMARLTIDCCFGQSDIVDRSRFFQNQRSLPMDIPIVRLEVLRLLSGHILLRKGNKKKKLLDVVMQVQNLIERCLELYMNKDEVVKTLLDLDHGFTALGTNAARALKSELGSKIMISREAFESLSQKVEESEKLAGMKVKVVIKMTELLTTTSKTLGREGRAC